MINATSESLKARKVFIFQHFNFCEQLKKVLYPSIAVYRNQTINLTDYWCLYIERILDIKFTRQGFENAC